jgi:hypothetical protein
MKNALKCVFELLDLVKNRENGTIFSEKGEYLTVALKLFISKNLIKINDN